MKTSNRQKGSCAFVIGFLIILGIIGFLIWDGDIDLSPKEGNLRDTVSERRQVIQENLNEEF